MSQGMLTLWMRPWKITETDQWQLGLNIRVRPNASSQQLVYCIASNRDQIRLESNVKVSWSWVWREEVEMRAHRVCIVCTLCVLL